MNRDRDFDFERPPPINEQELRQDLELSTLLDAMAAGDDFLLGVAGSALLSSLTDPEAIVYRQRTLRDCLAHPQVAREIYEIAVEALRAEKQAAYFTFRGASPNTILYGAVRVLMLLVESLERLRRIGAEHAAGFRSEGFERFFAMLAEELDDEYFESIDDHLERLRFRSGVTLGARLGRGNKGADYTLRRPREARRGWIRRVTGARDRSGYTFQIADRDESGLNALSELKARGINVVANALAQSADHITGFFFVLRAELGFYIACLNLHERLTALGEPLCFPEPAAPGENTLCARGLYDACLSLSMGRRAVGNELAADRTSLVVVTGANQGGKSTFLRSVGLAHLMMQCGLFVAAESFRGAVCQGVFTHYKREEDPTMESGKLDEELARMSDIASHIRPGCILLCNESFASTNEREGSEIAHQIVRALLDRSIRVFFVTHLFELADRLRREELDGALFLRAERKPGGRRTFRLVEGEPRPTSHGKDLYERVFGRA